METSEYISNVESLHRDAFDRGLFFQTAEDDTIRGRRVTVAGQQMTSFASCSYLGLEHHPALIAGVHEAVERYGTQFSVSRGYLSVGLYDELEAELERLFGAAVLVTSNTTLAHQSFFDAIVDEKDAVILDHQVHASVHRAAGIAKSGGTSVTLVHHESLERSLDLARDLARSHRTVWFATDGVASMYGDLAPVRLLEALLEVAPNVRLYIDDAHGMSWAGKHGRGSFLSRMPLGDRTIVVTSLNKAFSGSGGTIVFPQRHERDKVRMCGGAMAFSGPVQPPMLGADLASARLHLGEEIYEHQTKLARLIEHMNHRAPEVGVPLLVENSSPIFFVPCGLPRISAEVAQRMAADGLYVNVSMYPTVPMRRSGIRVSLTAAHALADVDRVLGSLARHVPAVVSEEGMTPDEVAALFKKAVVSNLMEGPQAPVTFLEALEQFGDARAPSRRASRRLSSGVRPALPHAFDHARSIHEVDREEWDVMLGSVGCISWEAQATAEVLFRDQRRREHEWEFDYVVVRDEERRPLAATVFTTMLQKDDMLMREAVSRVVEERRLEDPYFLTSNVVVAGTGLSEGRHIWLSDDARSKGALATLLRVGARIQREREATTLVIRDLPGDDDELDAFMLDEGFVKLPGLDTHRVKIDWNDRDELVAELPERRYRKAARAALAAWPSFRTRVIEAGDSQLEYLYGLYDEVASKKLRLNTFPLPDNALQHLARSTAWEVVAMYLDADVGGPSDRLPVAFWAAHLHGTHYAPLLCGLDYRFVASHDTYKQMILQVLERARELGCTDAHLGMDADLQKRRWGSVAYPTAIYVQTADHYNGAVLRELVAVASNG